MFDEQYTTAADCYVTILCLGLCCAALLARYGQRVTVCESHYLAGGAAQSFEKKGYQFDAGPSFFAGLSGKIDTQLAYKSGRLNLTNDAA